jgi:pimeloyl-ACP methyl ester carboxylesterase
MRRYFGHKIINLAAHSFGSYVEMLYASKYPSNVGKLTMFSPIGKTIHILRHHPERGGLQKSGQRM